MPNDDATLRTTRTLVATPKRVYEAFADADQLATWWGPEGFRNEFDQFDFQPGGAWTFVMVGPDGSRHKNQSTFVELVPGERVVIHHVSPPRFRLTVGLMRTAGGTQLTWMQAFEDPAVAAAVRHIAEPGNEQNLDRLAALLAGNVPTR